MPDQPKLKPKENVNCVCGRARVRSDSFMGAESASPVVVESQLPYPDGDADAEAVPKTWRHGPQGIDIDIDDAQFSLHRNDEEKEAKKARWICKKR